MVRAVPCKQALMPETVKAPEIHLRKVRLWLLTAAAMIFLTLVVGGATRLTESGLSIVEWKPVTGVLPPLSQVGIYAGRVLKGEKPATPAIQQSTKVELIVNLTTAKTLGLRVPTSLIGRADEVIE